MIGNEQSSHQVDLAMIQAATCAYSVKRGLNWSVSVGWWFLLDSGVAFACMWLAFLFSPYSHAISAADSVPHISRLYASTLFGIILGVTCHIFGLHNPLQPRLFWLLSVRCISSVFLAIAALAVLVFAVFYHQIGRYILAQSALYSSLLMIALRVLVWQQAGQRRRRLFLLAEGGAARVIEEFIQTTGVPFDIVAFADHYPKMGGQEHLHSPLLVCEEPLKVRCKFLDIDEIVTCTGGSVREDSMNQLMDCLGIGIRVSEFANFVERNFFQVPVESIRSEWFLQADLELYHPAYLAAKRLIDVTVSLVGLLVTSPLLFLAAVAIKLESRGPVFYSQVRTGLHNQPFRIVKLRSMGKDAERDGPQWASAQDSRVTRVGKILRRTRLDEVPQFWNILRGEMSLVGPRPERPEFVETLANEIPFFQQRHLVKPGLTGWAQINHPYGASVEDAKRKLCFDLYYLKYASIGLDLQIALRTIGVAMNGSR
jgi:exopolysaccharide biosynthesis polyprenyl glycosylphosphotransferase